MNKFMTSALLLAAGTMLANAAYVWTGAADSDWANESNWELTDGSTWGTGGPGASSSGMWDAIVFDGTKFTSSPTAPASLEGWNVKLDLSNGANITLGGFAKWQSENSTGGSYVKVDGTSKLTISSTANFDYRGDPAKFDIYSYEGLEITNSTWAHHKQSSDFTIDLHDLGSVKASWSLSGDINIVFSADLKYSEVNDGQYTISETSDDGKYRMISRVLWVNEHDNGGVISSDKHNFTLDGKSLEKSADVLAASADSIGKYYIEKVETETVSHGIAGANIVVSYVIAIPEPSAFGLLAGAGALALVAARRRRHAK